MFKKVLIANRGVIAHRILKTLKAQGISSVAIFTPGDEKSLHVTEADERICIRSYTEIPEIMSVSKRYDVEAIHPGVGFLSENIDFARVANHDCVFVGPNISLFTKMGNKVKARRIAEEAGLPTIPGSAGPLKSDREAMAVTESIGYPVILKAAEGGGGMGMEIVEDEHELLEAFPHIKAQAKTLFGSDDVFIEKLIRPNRHIEVQVLADNHGNVVHLGERDCSIQRRHQKLIEFSPADISDQLRTAITDAAVRLTSAVRYTNAGTVEFLVDDNENFYFMEMNTRIQVEHRVSEMVWKRDLIHEQLRCAAGEELGYDQNDMKSTGFALECRINAEDPERDFEASPGKVGRFLPPRHRNVIIDTFIPAIDTARKGYQISTAYDSLLANVIVWGKDKTTAINLMRKTLKEFEIEGRNVKTTIPFHLDRIDDL
jgi:acetyl-CoA carboxylase biotin carboxylase subunit